MTFKDYLLVADVVTPETNDKLLKLGRPQSLKFSRLRALKKKVGRFIGLCLGRLRGRKKTPESLDGLEIGQYLYLSTLKGDDYLFAVFELLAGLGREDVLELNAVAAIGFLNFARQGLTEISEAIEAQRIEPTQEERSAGSEDMDGGVFGMLDYISRRQHISHEEAEHLPWPTVVSMLKADKEAELYRRRLQKQFAKR